MQPVEEIGRDQRVGDAELKSKAVSTEGPYVRLCLAQDLISAAGIHLVVSGSNPRNGLLEHSI